MKYNPLMSSLSSSLFSFNANSSISEMFRNIKNDFNIKNVIIRKMKALNLLNYNVETHLINISSNVLIAVLSSSIAEVFDNIKQLLNLTNDYELINNFIDSVVFPVWSKDENLILTSLLNDYLPSLNLSRLFAFTLQLIRELMKKSLKKSESKIKLIVILAIHEVFDSFKRAFNDVLFDEIIEPQHIGDVGDVHLNDVEFIPYHRTKTARLPRGVRMNEFLTNFLYDEAPNQDINFNHQIQDFQPEEFDLNLNDSIHQAFINLINDFNFYVRLLPSINQDTLFNEIYNIQAANKTKTSIMKRYQ